MAATVTFTDFLRSLPAGAEALAHTPELRLVVGNESCDLDSMACSLTWAHYLVATGKVSAVVPVLQCHLEDLPLRTESVWLFQELGISIAKLVYANSLSVDKFTASSATTAASIKVTFTLVDHNSPSAAMADMITKVGGAVAEVIDHHRDEGPGKWECPRTIEPVGSCSTLVAEKLLGDPAYSLDRTVATLLLAAILLDTVNLSPTEGRVTERDSAAAHRLLPLVARQQDEFYRQLLEARLNTSWLTTPQLLQRDFKKVQCGHYVLGFCSIPCLISELAQREHLNADCHQFSLLQEVHALVLLGTLFPQGGPRRRQIGLYQSRDHVRGVSRDFVESVSGVLESQDLLKVEHVAMPTFDGIVLEQHNTQLSRKQIISMISDFLATVEHDTHEGLSDVIRTYAKEQVPEDTSMPHPCSSATLSLADIQPSVGGGAVVLPTTSHHNKAPPIAEYTCEEEAANHRRYRVVKVGVESVTVDLNLIQKYRGVVQHGGYSGSNAIIFISACFMPPRNIPDYQEVLHQLFFYILSILDQIVVEGYIIVYLHGGTPPNSLPRTAVFHKFYKIIDRRLRKQLQHLYIVHPTVWVKAMLKLMRPFVSSKFYRKVHFMANLQEASRFVPLDQFIIPEAILSIDTSYDPAALKPKSMSKEAPPTEGQGAVIELEESLVRQEATLSGQQATPTTEETPNKEATPTVESAPRPQATPTLEPAVEHQGVPPAP